MTSLRAVVGTLLIAGVAWATLAVGQEQAPEAAGEFRTWKDASGKFSTEAKIVRVDGDNVILMKKDGSRIIVAIKLLSPADQEFLAGGSDPFAGGTRAADVTSASQASVVVWTEANGRSIAMSGVVLLKQGGDAFVLFNSTTAYLPTNPPKFTVAVPKQGGKFTEIEATPVLSGSTRGIQAVKVDAGKIGNGLLAIPPARIREDLAVTIVGYEVLSSGTSNSVARVTAQGTVSKVYRDRSGDIARVQVSAKDLKPVSLAVVVDSAGNLVGATSSTSRATSTIDVSLAGQLEALTRPTISYTTAVLVEQTEKSATYMVSGAYVDRLQLGSPKFMVYPWDESKPLESSKYSDKAYELKPDKVLPNQFTGKVSIPESPGKISQLVVQIATAQGGKIAYSPPMVARLSRAGRPTGPTILPSTPTARSSTSTTLVPLSDEVKQKLAQAAAWVKTKAPKPRPTNKSVAAAEYELTGLTARALQLDNTAGQPAWSADGKVLYAVTSTGGVHRISFPSFMETHQLDTGAVCNSVCVSKAGVVVLLGSVGELFVLDPATLSVLRKIELPGGSYLSGSPQLDNVYLSTPQALLVVNTREGRIVSQLGGSDPRYSRSSRSGFGNASVTPDGKYLFTFASAQIRRYRVNGDHLKFEQSSASMGSNPQGLSVCADSKHVALPCGGGNRGTYSGFSPMSYGTYLFGVDDLTRPKVGVQSGAYPRTIDVDPKTGVIYAQNHDNMLLLFSPRGAQRGTHRGVGGDHQQRFTPHPLGGSLIVQTSKAMLWVKVPEGPIENDDGTIDDSQWLATKAPKSKAIVESLRGAKRADVQGIDAYPVHFGTMSTAGEPVFSPDGKWLYLASPQGVVRLVSMPDFRAVREINLDAPCSALALSKEGLAVGVPGSNGIYVLDDMTLTIKRRIPTGNHRILAASPKSSVGVGVGSDRGGYDAKISLVDFASGKVLSESSSRELMAEAARLRPGVRQRHPAEFTYAKMTPDGKYLLVGSRCLSRYKISGEKLVLEETSISFADNPGSLFVSHDSKYTAVPAGAGNRAREGDFPSVGYGTYIFSVTDFSKALVGVKSGAYPRSIAIDPKSGEIYAQDHDTQLIVFSAKGAEQSRFVLSKRGDDSRLFAHPAGGKLLVMGRESSNWVEFK